MVALEAACINWTAMQGGPLAREYYMWRPDVRSRSAADGLTGCHHMPWY